MKKLFIALICLTLLSSTCSKNDHYYITIINQSDDDIDLASPTFYDGKCALDPMSVVKQNSTLKFQPFARSLEYSLTGTVVLELYFVNNLQLELQSHAYDCDSIPIKNDILKHYKLTLDDLKQSNFTIVYP